jgi:hypothetical protein
MYVDKKLSNTLSNLCISNLCKMRNIKLLHVGSVRSPRHAAALFESVSNNCATLHLGAPQGDPVSSPGVNVSSAAAIPFGTAAPFRNVYATPLDSPGEKRDAFTGAVVKRVRIYLRRKINTLVRCFTTNNTTLKLIVIAGLRSRTCVPLIPGPVRDKRPI